MYCLNNFFTLLKLKSLMRSGGNSNLGFLNLFFSNSKDILPEEGSTFVNKTQPTNNLYKVMNNLL